MVGSPHWNVVRLFFDHLHGESETQERHVVSLFLSASLRLRGYLSLRSINTHRAITIERISSAGGVVCQPETHLSNPKAFGEARSRV